MSEILRPNLGGDETALYYYDGAVHNPDVLHNFEQVRDVTPDDASTYVYLGGAVDARDLYNLPAHTTSGTIKYIEVFFRIYGVNTLGCKPVIKSGTTVTEGNTVAFTTTWTTSSQQWTTNPATGLAWTWADIDALQIGIKAYYQEKMTAQFTQVFVFVSTEIVQVINETIEIRDETWTSPTGYEDPGSEWDNEANAYDEVLTTRASRSMINPKTWSNYLVLTHTALDCDIFRFISSNLGGSISEIDLDAYYDGGWHDVYQGSFTYIWSEKLLPGRHSVTQARMRYYNNEESTYCTATVYEFDFGLTSTVKRLHSVKLISETVGIAEELVKRLRSVKLVAETVAIIEAIVKRLRTVKLINETVALIETIVKRLRQVKLVAETVGITEGLIKRLRAIKIINETVTIIETVVRKLIAIGQPYIARVQRIFGMRTWGGN